MDWRKEKKFVRRPIWVFLALVPIVVAACSQSDPTSKPSAPIRKAQTNTPSTDASVPIANHPDSKGNGYTPPTAEEMAPMRPGIYGRTGQDPRATRNGRQAIAGTQSRVSSGNEA